MPKTTRPIPRSSRVVLKGALSIIGRKYLVDPGDGALTIKFSRGSRRDDLESGRLYYVRGILTKRVIQAQQISLADVPVPSSAGEDHVRFAKIVAALRDRRADLLNLPGVLDARAGYLYVNGWTTKTPAIVVTIDASKPKAEIPRSISGIPIDVRSATPQQQLLAAGALTPQWVKDSLNEEPLALPGWEETAGAGPLAVELEASAAKRSAGMKYVAPPGETLDPITDSFQLLCHSSPDSGWPELDKFLKGAKSSLTVAMYDFTAPHIATALTGRSQLKALTLVLDPGEALSAPGTSKSNNPKAHDEHEVRIVASLQHSFGRKLTFVWAAVKRAGKTTGGIFPTAYHIKVAVADQNAIWLSSGNWQSSNQPDMSLLSNATPNLASIFKMYNREWHVIATGTKLARLFDTFIKWDRTQAAKVQVHPLSLTLPDILMPDDAPLAAAQPQVHPPQLFKGRYTITPLLTPDNYLQHLQAAVRGAKRSIRIQNQYIKLPARGGESFIEFLKLLLAKSKVLKDKFRVIVRDLPGVQAQLEALEHFGFDMDQFKRQANTHTKGVIIDEATLIVGSHNWSNQGVLENRDASLLLTDPKVAGFYANLFDHDWQVLAHQAGTVAAGDAAPLHLNWSEYLE